MSSSTSFRVDEKLLQELHPGGYLPAERRAGIITLAKNPVKGKIIVCPIRGANRALRVVQELLDNRAVILDVFVQGGGKTG